MGNKAKVIDIPNIIRVEANGGTDDETHPIDEYVAIISIYAYLWSTERGKKADYRAVKAMLIRDLREARGCGFNPVPKNLPKEIFAYILNRNQLAGEGYIIENIQLTVYSDDSGLCHWFMDSETGQLFLGCKNLHVIDMTKIEKALKRCRLSVVKEV